jgi:hypothetical protein
VRRSLRQLFADRPLRDHRRGCSALDGGVALVFRGTPRSFIGTVTVDGGKGRHHQHPAERASQLAPAPASPRPSSPRRWRDAQARWPTTASTNRRSPDLTPHPDDQLVDIAFHVVSGPQARIGTVEVTGDPA